MYYAYLRVSTDKQDERNQKVGIDAYAKEHGIKYEKTFIEHISGTVDVKDRILSKLLKKSKKMIQSSFLKFPDSEESCICCSA